MRIISGKFKGRRLAEFQPRQRQDLRPTSDRNRESLFNLLLNSKATQEIGFNIRDAVVFDGFCGTGAVGFEALSRGAKWVSFADNSREHLNVARKNGNLLKVDAEAEFLILDLSEPLPKSEKQYNLVFLDPPYKANVLERSLENLIEAGYIADKTLVVIEYEERAKISPSQKLKSIDKRKYGKTVFEFFVLG